MSTERRFRALFAVVFALGVAAFLASVAGAPAALQDHALGWLLLVAITILVGLFPVQIPGTRSIISITDAFIFSSVLFFGVAPSVILAGADAIVSSRRMTRKWSSSLYSFGVMSLSVYAAATVFELLSGRASPSTDIPLDNLILPLGVMTLVHFILDSGLVAMATAYSRSKPLLQTWKDSFLWSSVTFFSGASVAAVLYIFVRTHGFATFLVVLPILFITYHTYKIYMEKVEEKNRHILEMSEVYLSTIEALTMAIDAKDQITYGHVRRVRVYALGLARLVDMSAEEQEGIKAAALLHDIGKLAIPEYILNKPGKLSPGEFEKMKGHTVIGSEILSTVKFPYPVIPMVRHHHEWWNGTGYPDKLKGEKIPLGARVLAIADCFDAMRSARPYHHAMTRDEAIQYVRDGAGTHFEPRLVDLFLSHIAELAAEAEAVPVTSPDGIRAMQPTPASGEPAVASRSVLDSIASAHREALALYEMAKVVGQSLSLKETMRIILEKVEEFVPYTTCAIYLKDEASDLARVRAARGRHATEFESAVVRLGEGATGWAIQHNRPVFNFDAAMDQDLSNVLRAEGYRCAATFPLGVSERVLGALTFYSTVPNHYTVDHERIMEIVIHQASMALLNAVIFEQTRASALTDDLTSLPNSRYLDHALGRRLSRADSPTAVVLMDLDGFKSVNDRFGHAAGDRVLKEAATVLQGALRTDDVLVRLGGDEFVVLVCEGTSEVGVEALSVKLQARLEDHTFTIRQGETLQLGLSAGHAFWPHDGATAEAVLAEADRRMYVNKAQRKRHGLRALDGGRSRRPSGEAKGLLS